MTYLIGSLRNPKVPEVAARLRAAGIDVFDSWYAAGPEADDAWKRYEQAKGLTFPEALQGYAARHIFQFDKHHLDRADAVVLVRPTGRSGHLELGYAIGKGKPAYILLEEGDEDRWDVMYCFAAGVFSPMDMGDLIKEVSSADI